MQRDELIGAIRYELGAMDVIVQEIEALLEEVGKGTPTLRDKTAAGAFLAQFYTAIENVLKHIARFHGTRFPSGETWHLDLFLMFREPATSRLPLFFDEGFASQVGPYRRFRHVVHHGYGFQLEWERMQEGMLQCRFVYEQFRARVESYLQRVQR